MNKRIPLIFLISLGSIITNGQPKPLFDFPGQDTSLTGNIYRQALKTKDESIAALVKEHKDDYKEIFEDRFELVTVLFDEKKIMADHESYDYLQMILAKIREGNKELNNLPIRLVFSKDWWPNAYSIGEGTLVVNAGLLVHLETEAELASVICHEISHLYLDHGNKAIKKNIEEVYSKEFKEKLKKLSKQEYGAGNELDKLLMNLAFSNRRYSRENEAEADSLGLILLKNAGYNPHSILDCLGSLDSIDSRPLYDTLNLVATLNFPEYAFRQRWIRKESAIFGEVNDDAVYSLSKEERDSLKTHPDCSRRIELLRNKVNTLPPGKDFAQGEIVFFKLKKRFIIEITEHLFDQKNYSRHLYYCLTMLNDSAFGSYATYATARVINRLFDCQKDHSFGKVTEKETRGFQPDYNLFLRMLDRVRLQELSELNYYFCLRNIQRMAGYQDFDSEWEKAKLNRKSFDNN